MIRARRVNIIIGACMYALFIVAVFVFEPKQMNVENAKMKTVRVKDIDIAYETFGKGYPLVLIMGYSGTMDFWDRVLLKKLASTYRMIIFDNRGMGKTTASEKEFTVELFADDTAALLDALGIERAHVLGWSMGTSIAQELAFRYPDKVNKLILYAADCGGQEAIKPDPEVQSQLTDTSGTAEERGKRLIKLLFPEKWFKGNPDIHKYFPMPQESSLPGNIDRQTKAMEEWQGSYSRLPELKNPTLVITGTDDTLTPAQNSLIIAERVPGAWLVRLDGCGHGAMYQCPEKIGTIVITFLED